MRPTVILLTFNSEASLAATLQSARRVSDEIFVVDSFSSDGTVELARSLAPPSCSTHLNTTALSAIGQSTIFLCLNLGNCTWMPTNG